MKKGLISILLGVCVILLMGFVSRGSCPSDNVLRGRFMRDLSIFTHLRNLLTKDGDTVSYIGRGTVEASGSQRPNEHKKEYLQILHSLGAQSITQNEGEIVVWYWDDALSLSSKSRSKGIAYFPNIKTHRYKIRAKLDGLEQNGVDGIYVREIGKGWFIIYMQDS